MFHCDHGKTGEENKSRRAREQNVSSKKFNISQMVNKCSDWETIEMELLEQIEAIRCAQCHPQGEHKEW